MKQNNNSIWFDNSKTPSNAAFPSLQPNLKFAPSFTKESYCSDPFVAFHNAIRYQIRDLCTLLNSTAAQKQKITDIDFYRLQTWLIEFSQMVAMYFTVQDNTLYPACVELQPEIYPQVCNMTKRSRNILSHLIEIHAESFIFAAKSPNSNTAAKIALQRASALVVGLADSLEDLFRLELNILVPVFKIHMSPGDSNAILHKCFHEFLAFKVGQEVMWGYIHTIPETFRESFLFGLPPLLLIRLKSKEKKWVKGHSKVLLSFGHRRHRGNATFRSVSHTAPGRWVLLWTLASIFSIREICDSL